MKAQLQFDFLVNKENNTITIQREFAADKQLVWDCHTKSELLNQWFAPKPFTTKTKHMDFREGGYWHYAMIDPEGTEYWARADYRSITPIDGYTLYDAFCNEEGEVNQELPRAEWEVAFQGAGQNTLVETLVTYPSLEALETVIQMGMQEGLASTLERLDELLEKLTK